MRTSNIYTVDSGFDYLDPLQVLFYPVRKSSKGREMQRKRCFFRTRRPNLNLNLNLTIGFIIVPWKNSTVVKCLLKRP